MTSMDGTHDPVFYFEAIKDTRWCDAMNLELRALDENDTWVITKLPSTKKAIGCKWVYRTKLNSDGSVKRHKARLVVLGCKQ